MKKFLAVLLSLAMVLALTACGGSKTEEKPAESEKPAAETPAATDTVEVAVVLKSLAAEYWLTVKDGCEAAAADLGIKDTVLGPNAESEIEAQVAMLEQQIGAGCDAIVCAPNDAGAAAAALKAAVDAGVPVLAVDTNVGMDGQACFVGTSNVDAAYQGGVWGAEQIAEGKGAVIIYGQEGDNTSNMRREGYTKAMEEAGIQVLDALSGQNTTDGATKVMEDMLTAHPDQIGLVLCHNDDSAIGAMNACKSAGISDVVIVGFNGDVAAAELIQQGDPLLKATVAQQPYMMGYQVVEYAVKAINGEEVPEVVNAPVSVITAENVDDYLG